MEQNLPEKEKGAVGSKAGRVESSKPFDITSEVTGFEVCPA